jgi:hypothetical protein
MKERSVAGPAVSATSNGDYTLSGFAGSAVTEMTVAVDHFAELVSIVRNGYTGRLVDILEIRMPD